MCTSLCACDWKRQGKDVTSTQYRHFRPPKSIRTANDHSAKNKSFASQKPNKMMNEKELLGVSNIGCWMPFEICSGVSGEIAEGGSFTCELSMREGRKERREFNPASATEPLNMCVRSRVHEFVKRYNTDVQERYTSVQVRERRRDCLRCVAHEYQSKYTRSSIHACCTCLHKVTHCV